jgi:heme oxygenase-like protein
MNLEANARPGGRQLVLSAPRGPLTERLFAALRKPAGEERDLPRGEALEVEDPLGDDDLQLALYVCYELHYASVCGVDERWEWSPPLLEFRAGIEEQVERALAELAPASCTREEAADVGGSLQRIVAEDDGPPLSRYLEVQAELEQMIEHVIHRSAYQLKEADPHSWAIPRLTGAPKAAMLEVQSDEYGGGRPERMHSALFEGTMVGLKLDPSYGAYIDLLPGITLATVNVISLWGLHRRLRGALVGHLATFEMTSSIPNRRYGNALRRLGFGAEVTDFYDEHVVADAVHESIAAWDLAHGLAKAEPQLAADILFGARALLALEARWANHLLEAWRSSSSSLRTPLAEPATL